MPPRNAPGRGGPRSGGGNPPPRGGRGGGALRGSRPGGIPSTAARVVDTIGARRPNYGTAGQIVQVTVNSFAATIPQNNIFHYDVVAPDKLPARFNLELFKILQQEEATTFTPKVVYDGKKNAFAPRNLPLGETNSRKFSISLPQANGGNNPTRPPKLYHFTLTKVAEINTEILERFVDGQQSHDEKVLTAIMALNVVIRMEPNLNHPFDKRSFYTSQDKLDIGGGLELWRGIFQSVRPTIGRLIVNIDLATGVMYKEGPLIDLCLDFFNPSRPADRSPQRLSPANGFSERQIIALQKFLTGIRVLVATTGNKPRVARALSKQGANTLTFSLHNGTQMTVAQYFASLGRPLRFPALICVQVGATAMIPLEMCTVPRGQIARKQLPDEKVGDVLKFSTKRPHERLESIKRGIANLQYGQSDYVNQFGMSIESEPLKVEMRIIDPPKLKYGDQGRQQSVVPKNGAWNMMDKKFFKPAQISYWIIMIYESEARFPSTARIEMIKAFLSACKDVGVAVKEPNPIIKFENAQGNKEKQMKDAGKECYDKYGGFPSLVVVILPDGSNDIYTHIKHVGDVKVGVPTQCLKYSKCTRAKPQYWANVMLKINVKLGGINVISDSPTVAALNDPANPTIVMGADVIHPPPGATDRPSFTALVGNVDSNAAKYVARSAVQAGRQEIIDDLKEMCKHVLKLYMGYREVVEKKGKLGAPPERLIFFRDGVSEGQFKHVLDLELPLIKAACQELGINPKITLIVVGKRHHNQFFPGGNSKITDKSGNCPAGSVIDRDITHPTEFDFFLLSHAGILGTSRPAHYSVLHDDFGFNADSIQALSFALCHVYARSTRSVSIPAPVYYADIVCSRAKNHFDPQGRFNFSDTSTQASGTSGVTYLEAYKEGFKPPHANQQTTMYFS